MSEDQPAREAVHDDAATTPAATTPAAQAPADATAADDAPEDDAPEAEGTGFVQVNRRRAPRYRAFVVTGLVLAFVVAAVVAVLTPPSDGYSQQALFGYLFVSLGVVGSLLGGLAAVLVERRSGRRSASRR